MKLNITPEMNVFEKIQIIEEQISKELPSLDPKKLPFMFGRVGNYTIGAVKKIDNQERLLYDFVLRHWLNPKVSYNWFLLRDVPAELESKLRNRNISIRAALKEIAIIRRLRQNPKDPSLILDIRRYVKEVVRW